MLTVYRIENERGEGPFNGAYGSNWQAVERILDRYGAYGHPSPQSDGIKFDYDQTEVCGCISMQQLDDWFPEPCRQKLEKHGFRLKTFVVEDAKIGKHQCVFRRS